MTNVSQFTSNGKYLMLALDHRGSFRKCLNPDNPELATEGQIIDLKREIIKVLEDQFSGLLIDVEYGLKAYQNRTKPFLLPVEKSGYKEENGERITEVEYSIQQVIDFGAAGAKLLLYFNPYLDCATKQLEIGRFVIQECKQHNFPLFIEIVTYESKLHIGGVGTDSITELILGSLKRFISENVVPDVWKLEYPGSLDACRQVTGTVGNTPWILLTRGDDFDTFKRELEDAIKAGAKGFLAGRALWQEVCRMEGQEKEKFLSETLPERFKAIAEVVRKI